MHRKAIFLDRDGVINMERGEYTYLVEDFEIEAGVKEALSKSKKMGFLHIIITNQAGISRKIYSEEQMQSCHNYLMKECQGLIDDIFFCPWHPSVSQSIMRKPDSVMLERAIALYHINPAESWMVGDKPRDIEAGKKVGLKTALISDLEFTQLEPSENIFASLYDFVYQELSKQKA